MDGSTFDQNTILKATKRPLNVLITDPHSNHAASTATINMLLSGATFGTNQPINLTVLYTQPVHSEICPGHSATLNPYIFPSIAAVPCSVRVVNRVTGQITPNLNTDVHKSPQPHPNTTTVYEKVDLAILNFNDPLAYALEALHIARSFPRISPPPAPATKAVTQPTPSTPAAIVLNKNMKILVAPAQITTAKEIAGFCSILNDKLSQECSEGAQPALPIHNIQGLYIHSEMYVKMCLINNINSILYKNKANITQPGLSNSVLCSLPYLQYPSINNVFVMGEYNQEDGNNDYLYTLSSAQCMDYPSLGQMTPITAVLHLISQLSPESAQNAKKIGIMSQIDYTALLPQALHQHLTNWMVFTPRGTFTTIITQSDEEHVIVTSEGSKPLVIKSRQFCAFPVMSYYANIAIMKNLFFSTRLGQQ